MYNRGETQNKHAKTLYVCKMDLTKALDYLNGNAFTNKLQQRTVDRKYLYIIKCMFHKSSSPVKWNYKIRKLSKNRYVITQGGVLSPKLSNEFLQDLRKYLNP